MIEEGRRDMSPPPPARAPPGSFLSENNATSPVSTHRPLLIYHMLDLFSQIPFKQCVYLWPWSSAATYYRPLSIHLQLVSLMAVSPSWQEEPPGSGFLLLFHIICLDITATLPATRGIITIFQYKKGRTGRQACSAWSLLVAPCCEEHTNKMSQNEMTS